MKINFILLCLSIVILVFIIYYYTYYNNTEHFASDAIIFYTQCNYRGKRYEYTSEQGYPPSLDFRSVRIPKGWTVTLYDARYFKGRNRTTLTSSHPCFNNLKGNVGWGRAGTGDWAGRVASFKITKPANASKPKTTKKATKPKSTIKTDYSDYVRLYNDCNYKGDSTVFNRNRDWKAGTMPQKISSIKIPKNRSVILYSKENLKGNIFLVRNNIKCLTNYKLSKNNSWNDKVRSFKIIDYTKDKINFFRLCDFKGDRYTTSRVVDKKSFNNSTKISSLGVPEGYAIQLFDRKNYGGNSVFLESGSYRCLNSIKRGKRNNWNNSIKSFKTMKHVKDKINFYQNCDYTGKVYTFSKNTKKSKYSNANRFSSVIIPKGYSVIIYDKESYKGNKKILSEGLHKCFKDIKRGKTSNWSDKVRSFEIVKTSKLPKSVVKTIEKQQPVLKLNPIPSSDKDCVIYYTSNKPACDAGFYLMGNERFNLFYNDANYKKQYDLEKVKQERDGSVGRICKLKYNGWEIDPTKQPIDVIADEKVLDARGNPITWKLCRKNILPLNNINSTYNVGEILDIYDNYKNTFAAYNNVFISDEFSYNRDNVGKKISESTPEYLEMVFRNHNIKDINSICNNKYVDYNANVSALNNQYGIELNVIKAGSNKFYINKHQIVKVGTYNGNTVFSYVNDDVANTIKLFYSLLFNKETNSVSYKNKDDLNMSLYKFYLDECNNLVNIDNVLTPVIKSKLYDFKKINGEFMISKIIDFPFNNGLQPDVRYNSTRYDKDEYIENISNITTYNKKYRFITLKKDLENYMNFLKTNYDNDISIIVNSDNDFNKQTGLILESYSIKTEYLSKVSEIVRDGTDNIFKLISSEEVLSKLDVNLINSSRNINYTSDNNKFTMLKTNLNFTKDNIYKFKLSITGFNTVVKPARLYVQIRYNNNVVGSYYYCKDIEKCINNKRNNLLIAGQTYGTASSQYSILQQKLEQDIKLCEDTNCSVDNEIIINTSGLYIDKDVNNNRFEVYIYSNYPENSDVNTLNIKLNYISTNVENIDIINKYSYDNINYNEAKNNIDKEYNLFYRPTKLLYDKTLKVISDMNELDETIKSAISNFNTYEDAYTFLGLQNMDEITFISDYVSANDKLYLFFNTPIYHNTILSANDIKNFNENVISKQNIVV